MGRPMINLAGRRFGRLTCLRPNGKRGNEFNWECACDCGVKVTVNGGDVRRGHTTSCGCFAREVSSLVHKKHGQAMENTSEYQAWACMRYRCQRKTHKAYPGYGGRGIMVCERWNDFENFFADMGPRPSAAHSIDRIDNMKGYNCGKCSECLSLDRQPNCRWAIQKEQARNKRNNRLVSHDGRTQCLAAWAEEKGLGWETLSCRLARGWTVERALNTPLIAKGARA
jgi:hypothetical protein